MNWKFEMLTSNNIDGTKCYAAIAEVPDDLELNACVESDWHESKAEVEEILERMKKELA